MFWSSWAGSRWAHSRSSVVALCAQQTRLRKAQACPSSRRTTPRFAPLRIPQLPRRALSAAQPPKSHKSPSFRSGITPSLHPSVAATTGPLAVSDTPKAALAVFPSGTRVNSSLATTETLTRSLIHELDVGRDVMSFCKQTNVADQRTTQAVLD